MIIIIVYAYIYFCSDRKKYNPFSRFARKVLVPYLSQWPCFLFDDVQVTRTREGNKDDSSKNKNNNHMLHVCMSALPQPYLPYISCPVLFYKSR